MNSAEKRRYFYLQTEKDIYVCTYYYHHFTPPPHVGTLWIRPITLYIIYSFLYSRNLVIKKYAFYIITFFIVLSQLLLQKKKNS